MSAETTERYTLKKARVPFNTLKFFRPGKLTSTAYNHFEWRIARSTHVISTFAAVLMCLARPSDGFDSQQTPDYSPKKVGFKPSISYGFGKICESYRCHLADRKIELINGSQPSTWSNVASTWVPANSPLSVWGLSNTYRVNKPTCFARPGCDPMC